jgi:type VI secretion system secreted protein VgrG
VGQEVIVSFLEGDPDRPIITGRVYNAEQMPPYKLPDNQTQSGVKSHSSKGGTADNFNEIRLEDKKGSEDLLIHAERTMHNSVEASQFITVGGDRHITTGGVDKDGNKLGDVKELVFKNHNLHVKTDDRIKIEGKSDLHVQGQANTTYDKDLVQSITGKCVIVADTIQLQGNTKIVLMAGSSSIVIDASGVTVLGAPFINLNTPGAPPAPEIAPPAVDPDDP